MTHQEDGTELALGELARTLLLVQQETGLPCSLIITSAMGSASHCKIWLSLADPEPLAYVPLEGLYGGDIFPNLLQLRANDLVKALALNIIRDQDLREQYANDYPPIFGEDGEILIP